MTELPATGERMVTSIKFLYSKFEHLHRYALAREFVIDKYVLDIACGEGYGTNLLAKKASFVAGVDISKETILHAREKYSKTNIEFSHGSTSNIPYNDNTFDIVVSFETIEHHCDHDEMLCEIRRVLKEDGILILSSPDKEVYHKVDPNNPFHIKELTLLELQALLEKHFVNNVVLEQRITVGSLIQPKFPEQTKVANYHGDFDHITTGFEEHEFFNLPIFNIVICSNTKIECVKYPLISIFSAYEVYENILKEKEHEIKRIQSSKLYKILSRIRKLKNFAAK